MLILAVLACTSNDSLFIQLTPTPTASPIPTALNQSTRFKEGDQLTLINANLTIQLPNVAGSTNALDMSKSLCFRNARVTVKKVAKSAVNLSDPTIYYDVQCPNVLGWVPEYRLTPFNVNDSVVIAASAGAKIFSSADAQTETGSVCANGTVIQIHELAANSARNSTDTNIYLGVTCGSVSGYILESAVQFQGSAVGTPSATTQAGSPQVSTEQAGQEI